MRIVSNEEFVSEIKSDELTVVDFYASWCGPCKAMEPHLEKIASDTRVIKIDIDSEPEIATQYGIRSVPTLIAFRSGEVVDVKPGAQAEGQLKNWIAGL